MFGHSYFGASYFGASYWGPASGAPAPATRSKYYSVDGVPVPFEDRPFDYDAYRMEQRRQQLHEDQVVIDIIAQVVTSRMLE